jgi:hypothetical protein
MHDSVFTYKTRSNLMYSQMVKNFARFGAVDQATVAEEKDLQVCTTSQSHCSRTHMTPSSVNYMCMI